MKTNEVIDRLARGVEPVRPLRRPWLRALWWLLGASAYMGIVFVMMTASADVASNGLGWRFLLPQIAALATSVAAAAAAFASVVPGSSSRVMWWVTVAMAFWLGSLVAGSWQESTRLGVIGLAPGGEWRCVGMIILVGAVPAMGMTVMLRHGAPLTPRVTTALAVLAAAALANVGACLSHPHPSSAIVLIWHGTTVAALVALGMRAGRAVLSWQRLR